MDDYLHRREKLIAEDRALRVDSRDTFDGLGRLMDDAEAIVRGIRAAEAVSVWGPDSNAAHHADNGTHIFPGMGFLTGRTTCSQPRFYPGSRLTSIGRDIILGTDLFKVMSKVRSRLYLCMLSY